MPNVLRLPIEAPVVPEGFCQTLNENWVQQIVNLMGQAVALLGTGSSSGTIILNQEDTPGIDQRGFLWFRPQDGRTYRWSGGAWISPHPYAPAGVASMWVESTPEEIWEFDGGDGSDPSVIAPATNVGAMWIIDPNYAGRSPMGVGDISGANPAKTLALGENAGSGAHSQTESEMFPHSHAPVDDEADGFLGHAVPGSEATFNVTEGGDTITMPRTAVTGGNDDQTAAEAATILHPVRGAYRIIRSARVNYTAT